MNSLLPLSLAVAALAPHVSASSDAPAAAFGLLPQSSYFYEYFALGLLALYVANFIVGQRTNDKIAKQFIKENYHIFKEQFTGLAMYANSMSSSDFLPVVVSLGSAGEATEEVTRIVKDSNNVYKYYCSGRSDCLGVLFTIHLRPRHDLFVLFYHWLIGSAAIEYKDRVEIAVNLDNGSQASAGCTMEQFIYCIAQKKIAHAYKKRSDDLTALCSLLKGAKEQQAKNKGAGQYGMVTITDSPELDKLFLFDPNASRDHSGLVDRLMERCGRYLLFMHVSDQPKPNKTIKICLLLPTELAKGKASAAAGAVKAAEGWEGVQLWNKFVLTYFIDYVLHYRLSAGQRAKNEATRRAVEEKKNKEEQKEKLEAIQKAKKEKEKAAQDKLAAKNSKKKK